MGAEFRLLTGIEVDILQNGELDQQPALLLAEVDVVVASVHSLLRMPGPEMTRRMVAAVANPHTDVLGHCTGRNVTSSGPAGPYPTRVRFRCRGGVRSVSPLRCRSGDQLPS